MASQTLPSDVLHEATDRLNCALLEAEDALRELNLGVTAAVVFGMDRALHFMKQKNAFQLVVVYHADSSRVPVLSTSRQTRLEAVALLPALRDKLLETYDSELRRVQESIGAVHAFTTSVRQLERKEP